MMKNEKGVALATLILAVIVMLTITGTITYTSLDSIKLRRLDDMYNDIRLLNQKITTYYIENDELPVLEGVTISKDQLPEKLINLINSKHLNNSNNYYIIDLEQLGSITLKYGKEYKEYSTDNTKQDIYIINENSHTIYYLKGLDVVAEGIDVTKYALEESYEKINRLPAEYQEVEYIEFTGEQKIDTDYIPNNNTKIKISIMHIENGVGIYASDSGSTLTTNFTGYASGAGNFRFGNKTVANGLSVNTQYTIEQSKDGLIINNSLVGNYDGYNEFTSTNKLIIGYNTTYFKGNIYYAKIFDNGLLEMDMVPCYRISDNVAGLYDLVNGEFYRKD